MVKLLCLKNNFIFFGKENFYFCELLEKKKTKRISQVTDRSHYTF